MIYRYESLPSFKEDQSVQSKQDVPITGNQSHQVATACRNSSTPAFLNKVISTLSHTERTPSVSEISAESEA